MMSEPISVREARIESATAPELSPTEIARRWIMLSIAAGQDPKMALDQKPRDGRRHLCLCMSETDSIYELEPKPLPRRFYGPAFEVLKELGRVTWLCSGPMPWWEDMLPGDCTSHAVGVRLKTAREAMEMDLASFYQPLGATAAAAKSWEAGKRKDWRVHLLKRLQDEHHIPLSWIGFGNCSDGHRKGRDDPASDVEEPRTEEAAS
jgi:hypothetical protein